jgi:hypothetical protein
VHYRYREKACMTEASAVTLGPDVRAAYRPENPVADHTVLALRWLLSPVKSSQVGCIQ